MKFTLITADGRIMQFYIQETAKMYQVLNGGVIITETIVDPIGEKYEKV